MQANLLETEVQKVFDVMRSFFTLLAQALSVLVAANVTVIGYAITTQTAGVLFVGAFVDLFAWFVMTTLDAVLLAPVYYRAIALRRQLGGESLGFFPVFLATYYRASLPDELEELTKISDVKVRTRKLCGLFTPSLRRFQKRVFLFGGFAALQLLSIPVLVNWFGWRMF